MRNRHKCNLITTDRKILKLHEINLADVVVFGKAASQIQYILGLSAGIGITSKLQIMAAYKAMNTYQ